MYQLQFINPTEVRMGSPYNVADVKLTGGYVPNIDGVSFQDKGVLSGDKKICYLVEWKPLPGGMPGFCVWQISDFDRSVKKSEVIEGCCEAISLMPGGVDLVILRGSKMDKLNLLDFS